MPDNEAPVLEPGEELAPVVEVGETQTTQPAEVDADAAPVVEERPKKPRGGFQARIDKLTREKYEAEARAQELQGRIDAQQQPHGAPERSQFESYEDYMRAVAVHEAKEAAKTVFKEHEEAYRQNQVQAEEQQLMASWEKRKEAAQEKYEDYDEVTNVDVPVSQAMQRALLESEAGADIAYYLGKNLAEVERILKLSPGRQFIEIGKLELKVQSPRKLTSGAPAPINALRGGGGVETIGPDDKDDKRWLERRYKELGRK